jgi:hypothetical protein
MLSKTARRPSPVAVMTALSALTHCSKPSSTKACNGDLPQASMEKLILPVLCARRRNPIVRDGTTKPDPLSNIMKATVLAKRITVNS